MKYLLLLAILCSCSSSPIYREQKQRPIQSFQDNLPERPTVVLISIDGYRHDYTKVYQPNFLSKIHHEGVRAELKPIFPSYTFPNHYSIVTGQYAENHGIINNIFYDPSIEKIYSLKDPESIQNPDWYLAEPIWVTAEKQGMIAGCHFWVGCEAKIKNTFPTYNVPYNTLKPPMARVETVLEWLKYSEERQPRIVTLYFSRVDSMGHKHGPLSPEVRKAIQEVDRAIEYLITESEALGKNINFIIVSDHGMEDLRKKETVYLTDKIKSEAIKFKFLGSGPMMQIYNMYNGDERLMIRHLKKQSRYFTTYSKKAIPSKYKYKNSHRAPDILLVAKKKYLIKKERKIEYKGSRPVGSHGYDPDRMKSMRGIFYAYGPIFKKEKKIGAFKNIHIQPLIAHILGLKTHKTDGKLSSLKRILERKRKKPKK